MNLDRSVLENTYYRNVIQTTSNLQLVLMKVSDTIPMEVHRKSDQFIHLKTGKLLVKMGKKNGPYESHTLQKGDAIIIPKGTYHVITNLSKRPSKLSTIYSPPHHPPHRKQLVRK